MNERSLIALAAALALAGGCGDDPAGGPDASPPPRTVTTSAMLSELGVSEPIDFVVPESTRSVTIIATGEADELLALGSLELGGQERVGLELDASLAPVLEERYYTEEIGQMPGDLYQVARLGTFTHVYPYAPGMELEPGPARLQVVSTATGGTVDLTILMPADDGAATLHVNVVVASESVDYEGEVPYLDRVEDIFAQADISVVVDEVVTARDTGLSTITDFSEPQEAPQSMSAQLALLGRTLVQSDALNVFVVDSLPFGVGGLSLGTPGPPDPDSYYYGVLLRHVSDDAVMARVFAHEVAHFLALHHIVNQGLSGDTYPDPIDDTEPGQDNLMGNGSNLTAGQSFALSRSALLELD